MNPPTLSYWPYCEECKKPFQFDKEEPFAYCACGCAEWGHPRPAAWVPNPGDVTILTVTEDTTVASRNARRFCVDDLAVPGSPRVGHGASIPEALGNWLLNNEARHGFRVRDAKGGDPADDWRRWHGHVRTRPDQYRVRCGGPGFCKVCTEEQDRHG